MEEIRVNRLPLLTYRYLHTNDTPMQFEAPEKSGEPTRMPVHFAAARCQLQS